MKVAASRERGALQAGGTLQVGQGAETWVDLRQIELVLKVLAATYAGLPGQDALVMAGERMVETVLSMITLLECSVLPVVYLVLLRWLVWSPRLPPPPPSTPDPALSADHLILGVV